MQTKLKLFVCLACVLCVFIVFVVFVDHTGGLSFISPIRRAYTYGKNWSKDTLGAGFFINENAKNTSVSQLADALGVLNSTRNSSIVKSATARTMIPKTIAKPTPTLLHKSRPDSCVDCNKHEYRYILNNDDVCKSSAKNSSLDVLIFILTEHSKNKNRDILRNSWLKPYINNTKNVRYVFLLGETSDEKARQSVLNESKLHLDIIKEDFKDTYHNLTTKTIMGMKWATNHCKSAKYIFKTDDDMWANIPGLLKLLTKRGAELETGVGGSCSQRAGPIRNKGSKWYASVVSYPRNTYPGFCSGTGYVTSMNVAQKVVDISPSVPFFHLEDVYISLCIRKLGYKLIGLPGFRPGGGLLNMCDYKSDGVITAHYQNINTFSDVWKTQC